MTFRHKAFDYLAAEGLTRYMGDLPYEKGIKSHLKGR